MCADWMLERRDSILVDPHAVLPLRACGREHWIVSGLVWSSHWARFVTYLCLRVQSDAKRRS